MSDDGSKRHDYSELTRTLRIMTSSNAIVSPPESANAPSFKFQLHHLPKFGIQIHVGPVVELARPIVNTATRDFQNTTAFEKRNNEGSQIAAVIQQHMLNEMNDTLS